MFARVWQITVFVRIWFNNIETVGSRKGGLTRQRGGGGGGVKLGENVIFNFFTLKRIKK